MVAPAATDGDNSRPDSNHDRIAGRGPSPSESLSPAPSSSPMPFLPAFDSTFTPLSMHSDSDKVDNEQEENGQSELLKDAGSTFSQPAFLKDSQPLSGHAPLSPPLDSSSDVVVPLQQKNTESDRPFAHGSTNDHKTETIGHTVPPTSSSNSRPGSSGHLTDNFYPSHNTQQPAIVKPMPIVRTASTKSVSLRHPIPDFVSRSASQASNIAQLEATAEKLSMTSSIESAIRDLHEEQKRADSRRSSILAASITSILEADEEPATFPMSRQISISSSIREINSAARHGGYSPAGYVMSPNSSVVPTTTRFRSGSTGMSKADVEMGASLSRHGPGKGSTRSVLSTTKPVLTNIAEIEPTALTAAAMDEADRLAEEPDQDDDVVVQLSSIPDFDVTPNANRYYGSYEHDYWNGGAGGETQQEYQYHPDNARPRTSAGSDGTFEQAERAFADFDGAHCSPDADLADSFEFRDMFAAPTIDTSFFPGPDPQATAEEQDVDPSRPLISRPLGPPLARPKSYLDPQTGETMLYYPARVPVMLNLPPKLSKKPKAEVRNNRRSQVLSTLPDANRQPVNSWLPEFQSEPLLDSIEDVPGDSTSSAHANSIQHQKHSTDEAQDENRPSSDSRGPAIDNMHRASRASMLNTDKRRSQIPGLGNLPPHLRASTYFELPSQSPKIQLKDGSATSTLDDILNASATAPVSAFTDHAFAGSLGSEVYGTAKKRRSHMKRASAADLVEPSKNRSSIFHLRKPSVLSRHSSFPDDSQKSEQVDEERRGLSEAVDGEPAPGRVDEEEEEEDDDEPVYNGPPTTLLAELQMRKQQQKQRTRPVASAFPNGMHSTLLEIDTVAELERRARKGKKVNLAWEEPSTNTTEDDDEEMPLALLLASKGQETGLIGAIAEVNRPLGLMEQRDMEDNEPLSVRRNRLQGREAGPIQRMTLARAPPTSVFLGSPNPELRVVTPEGDDEEEETLGDRLRRLRAREDDNPLPQPRPVSSSFSAELLGQLGDAFKDETDEGKDAGKDKGKNTAEPTEEEETLGQRRRRLQAEREAREREMARVQLNGGRTSVTPQLAKRASMADVLVTRNNKPVLMDPRDAERTKQEEAARYKREQEQKFATLRQQMPTNLSAPSLVKAGGFMSGRFNDGSGGGFAQSRKSMAIGDFSTNSTIPNPATNASAMGNAFRPGGSMSTWAPPLSNPYASPYGAPSPAQAGGQMDRVERWRQGVQP